MEWKWKLVSRSLVEWIHLEVNGVDGRWNGRVEAIYTQVLSSSAPDRLVPLANPLTQYTPASRSWHRPRTRLAHAIASLQC
jgi:hypothetical protein